METRDALERPGLRCRRRKPCDGRLLSGTQLDDDRVHFAGQISQTSIQLALDGRQPCFRALESLLRGIGGGDADLREAGSMLAQPANRILVQMFQLAPFLLDDFFELFDPLRGVLLQSAAGVVPLGEMGFEARDRARVALGRQCPASDNLRAFLGEQSKTLFRSRRVPSRDVRKRIQLVLKCGEALFEVGNARIHAYTVRA